MKKTVPDAREFCEDIADAFEEYECSEDEDKLDCLEEKVNFLTSRYCEETPMVDAVTIATDAIRGDGSPPYTDIAHILNRIARGDEPASVADEMDEIFDDIGRQ